MYLNSILENHILSYKSSKKSKFESLNSESQTLIKNASSTSTNFSAIGPIASLQELLNCLTMAKAVASLNQKLHLKICKVNIQLTFMTFVTLCNWVACNSNELDKISFLFLGSNNNGRKFNTKSKNSMRIHYQQVYGGSLSKESIDHIISSSFSAIISYFDLYRQVYNIYYFLGQILSYNAIYTLQFYNQILKAIEKQSKLCKAKFLQDSLFRLRFVCTLDIHFQQFLAECIDSSIIKQVDSSYYDLSYISRSIQHLQFSCNLPASLSTRVPLITPTKSLMLSAKKQGDSDRFECNEHANKDLIVVSTVKLGNLFTQDSMNIVPMFNNSY